MSWQVRYTDEARDDLRRLFEYLAERDLRAAQNAREAIAKGVGLLREFPFTCRKADPDNAFLRELIVSFGSTGYVLLYEIDDEQTVTVLAVRHQREDDYH